MLVQYPRPVYVGADLAMTPLAEALAAKGFDRTKPALFTCEGILCYLPQVLCISKPPPSTEYVALFQLGSAKQQTFKQSPFLICRESSAYACIVQRDTRGRVLG